MGHPPPLGLQQQPLEPQQPPREPEKPAPEREEPLFEPFHEGRETRITRGQLPHWVQEGVTYFVTFRLADSMPGPLLVRWSQDRARWLELHGICWDKEGRWRRELEKLPEAKRREYRDRFTVVFEQMLDQGHGACVLRREDCRQIVVESLRHFHGVRYWLRGFVVMPNHVHVLVCIAQSYELRDVLHSWKKFSARQIHALLGNEGAFWQSESWDHTVRDENALAKFVRYIRENPVKAGLREGFTVG